MKALVVTGLGVVSSIGVGREAFVDALCDLDAARAKSFGAPTVLDKERCAGARSAEVWGFEASTYLGDKGLRNFDRLTKFLIVAAKHALEDAGIKKDGAFIALSPEQIGLASSTAYGSLDAITELNLVAELEDPRYINPARFPNTVINAAAGYVSIWEDLRAPNVTVVDGNCGALDAVLTVETHLAHRRADVFLLGGGEVLSDPLYLAFRKLGIIAEESATSMPGDPHSAGVWLGEGAAFACVEREEDARARGARVLAEIAGYGSYFEPPEYEALVVHASSRAVCEAIRSAMADAGITKDDVDLVSTSLSGLVRHDAAELAGIVEALGNDVPMVAPKGVFGETFGAAGALDMAAAIAGFGGAAIGTRVGPSQARAIEGPIETVVLTAVGYYGNAAAVVLRRPRSTV